MRDVSQTGANVYCYSCWCTHNILEYPEWAEEAFNEILDLKEDGEHEEEAQEQSDIKEKEVKSAARSRSKSMDADEGEEPQHHGSINLNLPGVDVEIGSDGVNIETNIDPDGRKLIINLGHLYC